MMQGLRQLAVAIVALGLSGCAVPATYSPRQAGHDTGYSDTQLASTRWRVTFTGNSATARETVENYLLLRAAEITRDAGYRWFMFDSRDTETQTTYYNHVWPGLRGGWYRGFGMWGGEMSSRPVTSYEAYAEIVLLTDEQAKNEPRALGAADVIAHMRPLVVPKP